jgi:hypothetical protein
VASGDAAPGNAALIARWSGNTSKSSSSLHAVISSLCAFSAENRYTFAAQFGYDMESYAPDKNTSRW